MRSLFALLVLSGVFAQEPAASTPDVPKKGKLEGSVINALSKEPLRRAEVTIMPVDRGTGGMVFSGGGGPDGPPGTRRATTDQEGKYSFADIEPGRYSVAAQKTGFIRGNYGSRGLFSPGIQIQISAGQTVSSTKIELTPQAIIAGRVVDEEGEPMQNLQVAVLRERYMRGRKQMLPMGNAQTNDRGEFRIPNIMPGQVMLQISPGRWGGGGAPVGATDAAPNMAYVSTYYPGTTEMSQAAKIDVTAGAELSGFEVKLQKARVVRVRGKVLDPGGQPAKNYFVNLMPKDAMFFGLMGQQFSRTGDGTFELQNVQPGTYVLTARNEMGGPGGMSHSQPITVGTDNIEDLVIRLSPPTKVEGQIILKGDAKVDPKTVRVNLLMDDGGRMFGPGQQQSTKDDGTFVLDNVAPGKYRINAFLMPTEPVYIESIQYGDQDAMGKEIEVGSSPSPIRVVINSGAGTAAGVVMKDNAPLPGVTVVLLNVDASKRDQMSIKMGSTDQNANFTVKNIPPGDYLAFAFDTLEYGFWEDEERFKKIESKAKKVSVQRNGSANVNLEVTALPE